MLTGLLARCGPFTLRTRLAQPRRWATRSMDSTKAMASASCRAPGLREPKADPVWGCGRGSAFGPDARAGGVSAGRFGAEDASNFGVTQPLIASSCSRSS